MSHSLVNKKQKDLIKIFIFLFVITFIILNWNQVSWIFNYKELGGLAYDFFNPYQDSNLLINTNNSIIVNGNTTPNVIYDNYSSANNVLSIASIGVSTPVIIAKSTDITALEKDLDKGAVYYPGSVLPGQNGQIVILGHSAPPNWPRIKHDYIFTDIEKLNIGDKITLNFNDINYTYKVIGKKIIVPGQDIQVPSSAKGKNILTLVSCWPPGKNYKRITVQAELIKS